jgi:enediyne polyketide synthase
VRAFSVDLVPAPVGPPVARASADGSWSVFATDGHPLVEALTYALRRAGLGEGVLLALPRDCDESHTALMLAAAHAALASPSTARFVAVGDRRSASGLAKTLHLENPGIATTVVILPLPEDLAAPRAGQAAARIVADVAATAGFSEVWYDEDGERRVPVLRALPDDEPAEPLDLLGPDDVLLVTGGGKGITAECALALGRETGAAVGLLGRSDPAHDAELAANLERMSAAGVRCLYTQADVTSFDEVKAAVTAICEVFGDVTAVLHGAGRNEPRSLAALDEDAFARTLAPKIDGLEAVLSATDPARLRLLVSFSSIIGRAGLRGEADYATANDWLTDLTRRVAQQHPNCRCLSLEWSVWSGSGMGERLGVLESLTRDGVEPIPADAGVALLGRLIADPRTPTAVVAMGRAEGLPTLTLERPELPLLRFVERPRIHYPGVELVVDADLSATGDLYLPDHLLDGDLLFPAVLGIEAMTQAGFALTGRTEVPVLEDVAFLRPIVVPVDGATTIRVAVLATGADTVQAVIRSGETGFQADHFRATLRYRTAPPAGGRPSPILKDLPRLALRPDRDLYGSVLFQGGRFQRLLGYRQLAATSAVAEIAQRAEVAWFAAFLPGDLRAGDPGARDAFMHAIQCCVPDATLLPAGIERLHLADPAVTAGLPRLVMHAAERLREGDTYVYDVDVRDEAGALVEHWQGLTLQAVRKQDGSGPWHPALLGPYLERRTGPALGRELCCVVWPDGARAPGAATGAEAARRRDTGDALAWLLGPDTVVRHRPDGKPEVEGMAHVSASHGAGVTFAVAGERPVGCDIEIAAARTEQEWAGLLGPDGLALAALLAADLGEELSVAATRVWGAVECLRKTGRAGGAGLAAAGPGPDGWVLLRAGGARIASMRTRLREVAQPVVFTMLAEGGE